MVPNLRGSAELPCFKIKKMKKCFYLIIIFCVGLAIGLTVTIMIEYGNAYLELYLGDAFNRRTVTHIQVAIAGVVFAYNFPDIIEWAIQGYYLPPPDEDGLA